MNRRLAVRNLALLAGSAALLPACQPQAGPAQKTSLPLRHLALEASHEQLLAAVCDALLPRTTTPGAHDLGLHRYVLKMLDDCGKPAEQQAFVAGLKQLDPLASQQLGQAFGASSAAQRQAFLQRLDRAEAGLPAEVVSFYRTARQLTLDGYVGSKYFMTKQVVYELVPGRYNGYFPVSQVNLAIPRHGQS